MAKDKFFITDDNLYIIDVIDGNEDSITYGGKAMKELTANSTDAAQEKHVPVVEQSGNIVKVNVGSVSHPMEDAHNISWVQIVTEEGIQRKYLKTNKAPIVEFALTSGDKLLQVYAYCNLHGLWTFKA